MNLLEIFGMTDNWKSLPRVSGANPGFINKLIDLRNEWTKPQQMDDRQWSEYSQEEKDKYMENIPNFPIPQAAGIFRAITPRAFSKATVEGAGDLTLDRLSQKMLERAHRSNEGGLFQGSGKDRGNYALLPGKKGQANELSSVFIPEKLRGMGYGRGLVRDATQRNLRQSTKPLDLYAFKDPPKKGMPNLAQIYEKAGFTEVESFPYDPEQNTNLDEWIAQGMKDTDVGRFRYMEKFKKDPALLKPRRPRDESVLLDLKNLGDPSTYPKVLDDPQAQTEFYNPQGELSKDLKNSLTPENAKRLIQIGQQGIQENMPGWYNTRPILDEFVQIHGQKEGTNKFLEWADVNKIFSPVASPKSQLERASYAQYVDKRGADPSTLANAGALEAHRFPPRMGSLAHTMQMTKLGELRRGEDLRHGNLKRGQKIMPYGQALKGGINEFVADRHIKNVTTSIDPSLSDKNRITMKENEFYPMKKFYEEQVMPGLDIPLSQAQESVWGGAKDITGVSGVKSLAEILQELLLNNARSQHLTPLEAKRKYFNHDLVLHP